MFFRNASTTILGGGLNVIGSTRTSTSTSTNFTVVARRYLKVKTAEMVDLKGIFLPVPTPFDEKNKQSVHYEKLKENIFKWEKTSLKGYCLGGTNGEWPYLTHQEILSMIKFIRAVLPTKKLIIAGTSCESTAQTCEQSAAAEAAGANAVLVMVPYYFRKKMTDTLIINHFARVADSVSIPVLIYNNVFATGIDISLSVIEELAQHSNICGIKDTDIAKIAYIVEKTKDKNFNVIAGSAGYLLPALLMGCSAGMNGLAAVFAEKLCQVYTLAENQDWANALKIQKQLLAPDFLILRELGPAGLKATMDMLGYYGGSCRKPLTPISRAEKALIEETLRKNKLLH